MRNRWFVPCLFVLFCVAACRTTSGRLGSPEERETVEKDLMARTFNSGFEQAHDTYNGISVASDGKVYYVLSSESLDVGAQVFSYDPATDRIDHLGDLTEACGEKGLGAIPQGKSHVSFYESDGKLYFASHIGYYTIREGMETIGVPPPGYKPYPGGHFLAFDVADRSFRKLATAPDGEGILSMAMDAQRNQLYGLSWPTGRLLRYDLKTGRLENLGPVSGSGENGRGAAYRTLCRSLIVDPRDGSLYLTTSEGDILRCRYQGSRIERVEGSDLRKDYFGLYDPASPGHMGYNWRQVIWHPVEQVIYGVHGNSGYLFRFDPAPGEIRVLDRLTSLPSKQSGMFDQFSYGYLGFTLGPDNETLFYLTGGPIYVDGKRVSGKGATAKGESKGQENLHLVTYHLPTGRYRDHGPIRFENGDHPYYVNSIAVGRDETVYALSRVTESGRTRTDLIAVRVPTS